MTALDLPSVSPGRRAGGGPRVVSLRVAAVPEPSSWAAGHAAGRLPDASPYGLHRLAGPDLVVRSATAPANTPERWPASTASADGTGIR